jgi:CubicO group peptidase (beta-lactamase class C family)
MDELIRRYGVVTRPPGEFFDYSNLGYDILGEIVAHAAGKDLATFMRDEIFKPLGMMHSTLGVDTTATPAPAVPYFWVRGRVPHPLQVLAASTAYSSVHDLVRFGQMHAKVRVPGARPVLSDAAIDTMQLSDVLATSTQRYGIGWWVDENRFGIDLCCPGGTPGAAAWLRLIPRSASWSSCSRTRVCRSRDVVDAAIAEVLRVRNTDEELSRRRRAVARFLAHGPRYEFRRRVDGRGAH